MADQTIFQEAQEAAKQGQRERARDLLTRLLKNEKENAEYWLLMSSVVDSPKERIYCLEMVLQLEPENLAALQGLILFGAIPPNEHLEPVLPIRRKWTVDIDEGEELTGIRKVLANPVVRVLSFSFAGIVVIGIILLAIFAPRGTIFGPRLTVTPVAWTATPTPTETPTPLVRTPTMTPATAVPLWMLLEATYTPVPPYVNTPHPLIEAYRSAIRAYERGDYESMLSFMLQAQREEPESPDVHFHVGEAHRLSGDYNAALDAYEQALEIDNQFAPAYLGRAKTIFQINPGANILSDLEKATEYDPAFGEAFLELARYYFEQESDPVTAIEILTQGEPNLVEVPRFYMVRAQIKLALDDAEGALEDATTANELDITNLESYLVLGQAQLANELYDEAIKTLEFYGRYEDENALQHALVGWAYRGVDNLETALEKLDTAIELDNELYEAFLYRGYTHLDIGETRNAINDFYTARRLSPDSFDPHFGYALALVADERLQESLNYFDNAEALAISDRQLAMVYYHRALVFDALGLPNQAKDDFNLLILLPSNSVPRIWIVRANAYLATPTPTPTASLTITSSSTPTSTPTFTLTPTPTKTFTPTSTPSPTPTRTPTATSTITQTATPTRTPLPSRTP